MTSIDREMTWGQATVLAATTIPMVGFGALGAWGTYTNVTAVFHRSATALGVVAAGEGATLVLALVLVGLTMLGQASPTPVRVGLWVLPAVASLTGAVVAPTPTEAMVYAITPLAMCVSAEGLGLLARRIVVYRTGVDAEAQRRNAEVMRKLAYHRAQATGHPEAHVRKRSELASWKLAAKLGVGDMALGAGLMEVQRERMTAAADDVLADMFAVGETGRIPEIEAWDAPASRPHPEVHPTLLTPPFTQPRPAMGFTGISAAHDGRDALGCSASRVHPEVHPEGVSLSPADRELIDAAHAHAAELGVPVTDLSGRKLAEVLHVRQTKAREIRALIQGQVQL